MFDLSDLKNAKAQANVKRAEKLDEYDDLIKEGMTFFTEGIKNGDSRILRDAAKKFMKALSCRRDKVEPFSYLAAIFYLFDEEEIAVEFYEKANSLDPAFADLQKLKLLLFN